MRPSGLLAAGAISGAVLGAVVLLLWTLGSTAAEREPFSTQELAPRDVDVYIAVNTAPTSSQWIAFSNVLKSINVQDPLREAWNELLAEVDVDWESDVVSLLGDEGYMAITDVNLLEEDRGLVAAVRLRNEGRARDLVMRLADDSDEELLEEEYEGETIYYTRGFGIFSSFESEAWEFEDDWEDYDWDEYEWDEYDPDDDSSFWEETSFGGGEPDEWWEDGGDDFLTDAGAFAFVGNVAVVGLSREDVKGVIDVIHGRAPSIVENERFQELRELESDDFLMWGYFDVAPIWEFVGDFAEDEDLFDDETLADLKEGADRATFSLRARRDGFVLDASVYRQPGTAEPEGYFGYNHVFDTKYAEQVPEDTLAFVAGYDPYNGLYRQVYDLIADMPTDFTSPYCGGTLGGLAPFAGFELSEADDPVYGQFYDEQGRFDADAYLEWDRQIEEMFTDEDGYIDYEAYFAYFDELYEQACEEESQTFEEWLREFEADVGFELERDLLSLMTGEIALAFNARDFDADETELSFLGLIDVSNPERARESMLALVRYGEREEGLQPVPPDSAGVQRVYDEDDESFAWAVTNGTLALSYPAAPAEDFAHGRGGRSLAETANWQKTMGLLPEQTTFVGYVSLARIIEEVRAMEGVESDFERFTDGRATFDDLRAIRALGIAGARIEGGFMTRIVFFVED